MFDLSEGIKNISFGEEVDEIKECTGYSLTEILNILTDNVEFFELKYKNKVSIKDISNGKGFMSAVYRIYFIFETGEFSCIVKSPTTNILNDLQNDSNLASSAMTAEATFFNQVKGYNLPIPNFYFANDGSNGKPQCVIMQDYSNIATGVMFYEHVTNEMCLNFSKILAEFQAKVLELPFKLKESKFTEQAFGMFNVFMDKYIPDKFLELDSRLGGLLDQTKVIRTLEFTKYSFIEIAKETNQHLIVHGDAQSNNMLFYLNEDCSPSNKIAAWIDWQTLYEGNPLLDLSRFLTFCTDATVRRAVDKQCIDLYYNTLTELLTKSGITIPFTRDEAQRFYDHVFMAQAASMPLIAPMIAAPENKIIEGPQNLVNAYLDLMVVRAKHALEDAISLIEKYEIKKKFTFKS